MQQQILLSVTDLELLAGQAVKGMLTLLFVFGCIFNVIKAVKAEGAQKKTLRGGIALFFLLLVVPLLQWIRIEDSLLRHPAYTPGVTLDTCQVFAKGKGILFEYEVAGKKYRNCNTYHPIPHRQHHRAGGEVFGSVFGAVSGRRQD
ncbi:MAG: hypothetical protein IPM81_05180 [Saprospirales bacterium]|nr:hypothetical protein [Saprospirales bacterium]